MADFPINLVDVTVIAILAISGIFALVRGLVHELLAVGSWIGAAIATLYFFPRAQPVVRLVASRTNRTARIPTT